MEKKVKNRHEVFVSTHRSDEERQAYISASRHVSCLIAKAKTKALQTASLSLSLPNPIPNFFTPFFDLLLVLLFPSPLPLTSQLPLCQGDGISLG